MVNPLPVPAQRTPVPVVRADRRIVLVLRLGAASAHVVIRATEVEPAIRLRAQARRFGAADRPCPGLEAKQGLSPGLGRRHAEGRPGSLAAVPSTASRLGRRPERGSVNNRVSANRIAINRIADHQVVARRTADGPIVNDRTANDRTANDPISGQASGNAR